MTTLLHAIMRALIAAFGLSAVLGSAVAIDKADNPEPEPEPQPEPKAVTGPVVARSKPRKRPNTGNRVTYRVIAVPKGPKAQAEIKRRKAAVDTFLPMDLTTFNYVSAHPGESARQIADATGQNGKTVESALYRLRRIYRLIESVGQRGDVKA